MNRGLARPCPPHLDCLPGRHLDGSRARGRPLDPLTRFGTANFIVTRYDADGTCSLEGGADPRRDDDARGS